MTLTEMFKGLLNAPDLIILTLLFINTALGFAGGFMRTLCGLVGRLAALAGACVAARALAPMLARLLVTPIVGKLFESRAEQLGELSGVLDGLQASVTEAATGMAESVAYFALLVVCFIVFSWVVSLAAKTLHFLAHLTPLGVLDSLGGGALGLAGGVLLVCVLLIAVQWFSPIAYTPLGWLSPGRVEGTVLLQALVELLPVAI